MGNGFYLSDYDHHPDHQPWVDFSGECLGARTFSKMWMRDHGGIVVTAPDGWIARMVKALRWHREQR